MKPSDHPQNIFLRVKKLVKSFPLPNTRFLSLNKKKVTVVKGIDLEINSGETLGLVGESGCGKSTTLRSIAQLYNIDSGEIWLDNVNIANQSPSVIRESQKKMQVVFQDPYSSLNPNMSIYEIISEPLVIRQKNRFSSSEKKVIHQRVMKLIDMVGISRTMLYRYPHEFSGGQKQRINIARALALNPQLILADEPVSALDVSIQAQILNLFKDLQNEFHLTYLFIAHDLSVINFISHYISVMYLGEIVEHSARENICQDPLHPYTQALISAIPIPDPQLEKQRSRILLEGDVSPITLESKGCIFYDRCFKRLSICQYYKPKLKEVKKGHKVACFLYYSPLDEENSSSNI